MKKKEFVILLFTIILLINRAQGQSVSCVKKHLSYKEIRHKRAQAEKTKPKPIYADVVKDIFYLNYNLLSFDTYAVIASIFPFYAAARMIDQPLQCYFHCRKHHKNVHQMPWWCNHAARFGLALPFTALASLVVFSHDEEVRQTSWIFIWGMPFLIFGNKITKRFTFEGCERPWHEDFSSIKRSCGGFPSGHMSEVTYMAALYGMRFGPAWGVPLALYGLFVGTNFLISNRHYISQLVGGIGWGLMYAFSANKVIDNKMKKYDMRVSMTNDFHGAPALKVSCSF